jgi:hypothetical protein
MGIPVGEVAVTATLIEDAGISLEDRPPNRYGVSRKASRKTLKISS